jgi:hypothetical protein
MQVVHTLGEPPRYGSTILAHIGWRTNSDAELTATVRTNGTTEIQDRLNTIRRFSKAAVSRKLKLTGYGRGAAGID